MLVIHVHTVIQCNKGCDLQGKFIYTYVYRHHDLITGWILIINHQMFTDCLGCTVYKIQNLQLAKSLSHYHGY